MLAAVDTLAVAQGYTPEDVTAPLMGRRRGFHVRPAGFPERPGRVTSGTQEPQ